MRRLLLVLVGAVLVGLAPAGVASAAEGCVSAAAATYKHTFDGPGGTATVTAVKPLCAGQTQSFSLVSYTAPSSSFSFPQFVYGVSSATVSAKNRSVKLAVSVPGCYTQVDLIIGTGVLNEVINDDTHYWDLKLGSPEGAGSRSTGPAGGYNGGSSQCVTKPQVVYDSACSGAFGATLRNEADANVDAVFVVAGRRIRVAPGASTTVTGPRKGTLSIRDDSFTTNISTWSQPSTGCTTTAPTTSPVVATSPTAVTVPVVATTPATASPSPSETATMDPSPANGGLPTASIEPSASTALGSTGLGFGSKLIVALGILLVGLGAIVLVRLIQSIRRP